jgi:hypothetical protein
MMKVCKVWKAGIPNQGSGRLLCAESSRSGATQRGVELHIFWQTF